MHVIIAGTRNFDNYTLLCQSMAYYFQNKPVTVVLSGAAKGADSLGEKWARENNKGLEIYPADWNKYGKAAGPIRNKTMAEQADACIVFWDGESRGTANMIEEATKQHLLLRVVRYDKVLIPPNSGEYSAKPISLDFGKI